MDSQGIERSGGATGGRLGRYVLLGTLGRGGMGEVVRARAFGAQGATKDLCLKRIHADRLARPGALERFVEEARLSLRLAHGNIVSVFDFGRAGDEHFLAMEWIDGADLREILHDAEAHREPLPPAVAAHVAAEIARALGYAHALVVGDARGVVHCDVKPGNVMIARTGEVKLTDFGVATAISEVRGGGTEGYVAPEVREGGAVGPSCDLYALGVVLAEMLVDERVHDPARLHERVPVSLEEIAARLLARGPADRPRSAGEIAQALESFVARERAESGISPRDELARRAARIADARALDRPASGTLEVTASFAQDGEGSVLVPTAPTIGPPQRPRAAPPRRGIAIGVAAMVAVGAIAVVGPRVAPIAGAAHPAAGTLERVGAATLRAATLRGADTVSGAEGASEAAAAVPAGPVAREGGEGAGAGEGSSAGEGEGAAVREGAVVPRVAGGAAPLAVTPGAALDRPIGARRARSVPASALAAPEPMPSREPVAPVVEPAHDRINAIPWASVELDGRAIGVTPLLDVELAPGHHSLRFFNDALRVERTQEIDVGTGERRDLVIHLE